MGLLLRRHRATTCGISAVTIISIFLIAARTVSTVRRASSIMRSSGRRVGSLESPFASEAAVCGHVKAGNISLTTTNSTAAQHRLIVNNHPDAPCCGGEGASVNLCLSIASAAWLGKGDEDCDALCEEASAFFVAMESINTLQITTVALGAVATFMWMVGTFAFFLDKAEPNAVSTCAFALWFLCCLATIICQCIELGIVYSYNAVETAETIQAAGCYNAEGDLGYIEVVSNLRSSRVLLWGELAVSTMALVVGLYSMYELFITQEAKVAPMMLEALLLIIEDGIAVGGLVFLLQASNEAITKANDSLCVGVNASTYSTDQVLSCVAVLPPGDSGILYKTQYLQRCGRTTPHVSASLQLGGITGEPEEEALRMGITEAAAVGVDAVAIDLVQYEAEASRRASSLVWAVIDASTPTEAARAAHQLETAAYGDRLLTSLQSSGVETTSAKLLDIVVREPGQRDCAPGQYMPEGVSTCAPCEAQHFCGGRDLYKAKCANGNSPPGSSSRAACVCAEGFGGTNGVCMDCSRLACAANNYTVGCGGTSAGTCQSCGACEAGSFSEGCARNEEGACKPCPVNTYALGSGVRVSCESCETACAAGQYAVGCGGSTNGTCVSCNASCPVGQSLIGECVWYVNQLLCCEHSVLWWCWLVGHMALMLTCTNTHTHNPHMAHIHTDTHVAHTHTHTYTHTHALTYTHTYSTHTHTKCWKRSL
jgi:hypothetical protein